jgi:acetyl-coenzyme A carboxylase carboxyl transferase subunit alpha
LSIPSTTWHHREACAAILWRDAAKAPQAAEALKITAEDLRQLGLIDEILPEPVGGAHADPLKATEILREALVRHLSELNQMTGQQRRDLRYQKFRAMGIFSELSA